MASLTQLRREAVRAVVAASQLCVAVQALLVSSDSISKKDSSPVTIADYGAQAVVIHHLTTCGLPAYPFIAEESGKTLQENPELREKVLASSAPFLPHLAALPNDQAQDELVRIIESGFNKTVGEQSQRWWTLDPIDGTQGFLRRGQYAVALALMENNEPILGVLGCPELPNNMSQPDGPKGQILVGLRGEGAVVYSFEEAIAHQGDAELTGGTPLKTSQVSDPTRAELTESFERRQSAQDLNTIIANELGVAVPPVRIDSQCKYAIVARGESSIYLRLSSLTYREKIWDHAAGVIIVEEAGGKVTDFRGNKLDFSLGDELSGNTGIVCTNGILHDAVMAAINKVDAIGLLSQKKSNQKEARSSDPPVTIRTSACTAERAML